MRVVEDKVIKNHFASEYIYSKYKGLKMTNARTRHLPVIEDGKLMGIISIGDVVKKASTQNEDAVSMLES